MLSSVHLTITQLLCATLHVYFVIIIYMHVYDTSININIYNSIIKSIQFILFTFFYVILINHFYLFCSFN